ncbi:UDP-glucose 4-epimerase [Cardiosporidium cionae]|uniref:UDP-glucose 4-epimerase n=1 Tax=Cardiosporidium cionae TaxID=476202 RepID=A0ABQ7J403_9APIC|nr:UDP-glucose 4-epimerase [Cardiosporidium cionae]|eukprot:KAF8817818.1 UDP-glucose 4-epimerase [Cardiosporidium cionae]
MTIVCSSKMSSTEKRAMVLCVGGTGYIGSHTAVQLLQAGYNVAILDNCSSSSKEVIGLIENVTQKKISFFLADLMDVIQVRAALRKTQPDVIIHFASFKSPAESLSYPLNYYRNNLVGTINLLQVMKEENCKRIIFSSSAAVYKLKESLICEDDPVDPSHPYGQSKLMIEQILKDVCNSDTSWKAISLRYFNPIGAHSSGLLGDNPEYPTSLLPIIQEVASGHRTHLNVYGNDWNTRDGTGERDYIHIEDLVAGHVAAVKHICLKNTIVEENHLIYNIGTGVGTTVLELKQAYEKACGCPIPHVFTDRRKGDLGKVMADPTKARKDLNWEATRSIEYVYIHLATTCSKKGCLCICV